MANNLCGVMPEEADLLIYQGADFTATVEITNGDGTPADLTGYTAFAQLRRGPADEYEAVECDITITIEANRLTLSIPNAETTLLCGRYEWDLDLVSPENVSVPVLKGKGIVTAEITRAAEIPLLASSRNGVLRAS